jgi:phage anti-repressor protein
MNTQQQAIKLIEMICDEYKITKQDLKKKRSAYTKKYNQKHYVSISSIRQSLSYFIYMHFPLTITQVAKMVGYSDHSPLSCQRKQIEHYIKTKDLYFFPYYEKVKEYAYLLGVDTKYKRMIIQEIPFVRYENNIDFLSNLKYYENAKAIR